MNQCVLVPLSLPSPTQAWLESVGITEVRYFRVPMTLRFRRVTAREGLLLRGEQGWGECAPFRDYGPEESSRWLRSALAMATAAPPREVRRQVPVNVTIPVIDPESAFVRVKKAQCTTAKVKVADPGVALTEDAERVRAVAGALREINETRGGSAKEAHLRVDANGAWSSAQAIEAIGVLEDAASAVGGLEYVEQPCETVPELAFVRSRVDSKIAADESIRRASNPLAVVEAGAADLAVIKVAPLGGTAPALELQKALGIPVVVSSAIDTSIGLAAGVQLAAALPELPFACGLDTGRLLKTDVVTRPLQSRLGMIAVSEAVDLHLLPPQGDADPADLDFWTDRLERMRQWIQD